MHYRGLLYRCLNPVFAATPLSGEGARRYCGRFNAKGTPALYTSLSITTAIREANQVGNLQPTMLVSYGADLFPVFDGTSPDALARQGMAIGRLSDDDWRDQMRQSGISDTQALAAALIGQGYVGMVVRSFAPGATEQDLNMVLWQWQTPDAAITLIDDERRLPLSPT